MKALVTGGTGFIGSHLVECLIAKNIEVYALVRDLNNVKFLKGLNIHFLQGDLFSIPSLPADLDYVFHLAGLTKALELADYYTVNQHGTASLFQSLCQQKIFPKVIYLSSLAAGGPSRGPLGRRESEPAQPVSTYGDSKLKGEQEALRHKEEFQVVILRVGIVFGPRDKDFLQYLKLIKHNILPSFGFKQKWLSLCYVKDLAQALYLAAQKEVGKGEIFHIGDPTPYDYDDVGRIIGHILDKKPIRVVFLMPAIYLISLASEMAGRLAKRANLLNLQKFKEFKQSGWVVEVSKAKEILSLEPQYSLEKALEETIGWYKKNGWL